MGGIVQYARSWILVGALVVTACAKPRGAPDTEPTLKGLPSVQTVNMQDNQWRATETQAIEAYRQFLQAAPMASQRAEALRRIGDLEMSRADLQSESDVSAAAPDYTTTIQRYQEYLAAYPNHSGNDRVFYQLARAQEQAGHLETALRTLDTLVQRFPETPYVEEAQFRRGELLFTARNYRDAQSAYQTVLARGADGRYHDRALYMRGWSQFKLGQLEEALSSFFDVLDAKLGANQGELSRADKELTEDTLRVTSLSLASLQGASTIARFINSGRRQQYEPLVFEHLGSLYLKQERVKDAADTFALFATLHPLQTQAPLMQARVIDIYAANGFATLALQAKKDYVVRYGHQSLFRQSDPQAWEKAQALVKQHTADLARHHHANAQKSRQPEEVREAIYWYREYLAAFPYDLDAANNNFLLAELLFENGSLEAAKTEYERSAYDYGPHARSADAGYAALLCYARQLSGPGIAVAAEMRNASVVSALRFADTFPMDSRTPAVLADTAERLFAWHENDQAIGVARRLLDRLPEAPVAQRRIAWTVLAHAQLEQGAFPASEAAYSEVLALTADNARDRAELTDRLAAAVYKQGEAAQSAGRLQEAVGHFERVATVAPASAIRPTAAFDAALTLVSLQQWSAATQALENFRKRFPQHPLNKEVAARLAQTYLALAQWGPAARELERLAATHHDPDQAREALWQAASLHEKAGDRKLAAQSYERFLGQNMGRLEPSMEARFKLAKLAQADGNAARESALMKEILQADRSAGDQRSDRTRYLGAHAALALAEPQAAAYRKVWLTEPLQRQLKLKKQRMEEALQAYALAADYGVADVSTATTYLVAGVYRDFAKALLTSERPRKLGKLEREQYDVLLEEQAFPFEEKASTLHELNAKRVTSGIYDTWVQRSFEALKELQPVRYGKTERTDKVFYAIQ